MILIKNLQYQCLKNLASEFLQQAIIGEWEWVAGGEQWQPEIQVTKCKRGTKMDNSKRLQLNSN